jgi:hypothetical protein
MTDSAKTNAATAGAGAVDEFAHIPRPRVRHPIVGAAGAALAFFLVFHIRHDLRYALSSRQPAEIGSARAAFAAGASLADFENRLVRVTATPDRESALEIDTKGSWVFSQLFRVLGTGDRMFLHRRDNPLPAARAEADVFEGRLIRFRDLSFADAIRAHFAKRVTATHFFPPAAFVQAIAGRAGSASLQLADRAGDPVALAAEDSVAIEMIAPDQVRIGLPRARFANEADARAAIASRGGEVLASRGLVQGFSLAGPDTGPLSNAPVPPERWTFVARFPAARRQAALDELGNIDRRVELRDARETVTARVADLAASGSGGGGLTVGAAGTPPRTLAAAEIAAVRTLASVVIPDDAYLLVEGDYPREHVATIFIALILLMFGTVNLLGIVRNRGAT